MSVKLMISTVTVFDNEMGGPNKVVALDTTTNIVEFDTRDEAEVAKAKIDNTLIRSPSRHTNVSITAVVLA